MTQVIAGTGVADRAHDGAAAAQPDAGPARLSHPGALRAPGDREEKRSLWPWLAALVDRPGRRGRRLLPLREGAGPAQQQQGDRGARRGPRPAPPRGGQAPRGRADDERHLPAERDGAVRPGDQPGPARRQQGGARVDRRPRGLEGLPDGRDSRRPEAELDRCGLRAQPGRPQVPDLQRLLAGDRRHRDRPVAEGGHEGEEGLHGPDQRLEGPEADHGARRDHRALRDRQATLRRLGFHVARTNSQDSVGKGTVISEDPQGGTQQPIGSTITLTVSSGPGTSHVPDVTTDTQADAMSILPARTSSSPRSSRPVTDPTQDGTVISQTPQGGTTAKPGSLVTITVGQFSQTTTDTTTIPSRRLEADRRRPGRALERARHLCCVRAKRDRGARGERATRC